MSAKVSCDTWFDKHGNTLWHVSWADVRHNTLWHASWAYVRRDSPWHVSWPDVHHNTLWHVSRPDVHHNTLWHVSWPDVHRNTPWHVSWPDVRCDKVWNVTHLGLSVLSQFQLNSGDVLLDDLLVGSVDDQTGLEGGRQRGGGVQPLHHHPHLPEQLCVIILLCQHWLCLKRMTMMVITLGTTNIPF